MIIPQLIAHRGLHNLAPENTLKAFRLAEQRGAQMFECDVLLSQDHIPLIFHDDTLERCTNGRGKIRATPFALLKTLDAGQGELIPRLTQVLSWLQQAKINMNLELKYATNTDPADPLATLVCQEIEPIQARILVSSFNLDALYQVRQALPQIHLGLLIDPENFKRHGLTGIAAHYQQLKATSIHCDRHLLSPEHIQKLRHITPHCLAYTVNDADTANSLFAAGVTGIFTDALI